MTENKATASSTASSRAVVLAQEDGGLRPRPELWLAFQSQAPGLADLIDAAQLSCFAVLSLDGCIDFVNHNGLQLLEAEDVAQLRGRVWASLWPGAEYDKALAALDQARGGERGRFQAYAKTLKGHGRWWDVIVTPWKNAQGRLTGFIVVSRDMTEFKIAEASARKSHDLLQLALDEGALGSWSHDQETGALACSAQFRKHMGLPLEGEVRVDDIMANVEPQSRPAFLATREAALQVPGAHRLEMRIRYRDGHCAAILTHFYVEHRQGMAPLVSGISVDVTARQDGASDEAYFAQQVIARTQLLADLNAHAIASVERERKFLARELHDEMGALHTLMALEIANTKQACEKGQLSAQETLESLGRLNQLLKSLREYKHRIIAGLRPPLLEDLGLELAIRNHLEELAQRSNLVFHVQIDESLPEVQEDVALALFRVLQEAMSNTSKYAQAKHVHVSLHNLGDALRLEVVDDGVGLPDEPTRGKRSYGLLGIRERIQALGGWTQFQRAGPKGGTRIVAVAPCSGRFDFFSSSSAALEP